MAVITNISSAVKHLRTVRDNARAAFWATRSALDIACDDCAANYSLAAWDRIGETEAAYNAARDALDRAEADFDNAEMISLGLRKAS